MKKILCLLLIFCSLQIWAQSRYTYWDNKAPEIKGTSILKFPFITDLSSNPAFAGAVEKPNLNVRMHGKWLNMANYPLSILTQFDMAAGKDKRFGFGIIVDHYQFNTKELYTIDLAVSVKFRLGNKNTLRWGISAVSFNKNIQNINRSGRIYEDMISPFLGLKYPTFERQHIYNQNYFDLKTGVWLTNKNYFAGFSILHIGQYFYGDDNQIENIQNLEPAQLPVELVFDGGYQFKLGKYLSVTPMIKINSKQGDDLYFSPSLNVIYNDQILAGIEYHNMNIVALNLGTRLYRHFNIIVTAGTPLDEELKRISKFALFEAGIGYIF
jgi:type IX secretion system PorP/SprF family membrane protein